MKLITSGAASGAAASVFATTRATLATAWAAISAAAAAVTTTTTCTAAIAAESTASRFFFWTSRIDFDLAIIKGGTVELFDRFFCFGLGAHLHEGKSLRLARFTIFNQFHGRYGTGLGEQSSQSIFRCIERKISYVEFYFHFLFS